MWVIWFFYTIPLNVNENKDFTVYYMISISTMVYYSFEEGPVPPPPKSFYDKI